MAQTTAHRTQVLKLRGNKWAAICSCGYLGEETDSENAALDANEHRVAAARGAGRPGHDPRQLEIDAGASVRAKPRSG